MPRGLKGERVLDAFASGRPASTPSLAKMQAVWERIVAEADPFLDT